MRNLERYELKRDLHDVAVLAIHVIFFALLFGLPNAVGLVSLATLAGCLSVNRLL